MSEDKKTIQLTLKPETAAWLRSLLEGMQVNGSARDVRRLLNYADEVLAQLPEPGKETAV